LLSTPPHDGAVTLSYKPWNFRLERDFHSPDDVRFRAHGGLDESSPYRKKCKKIVVKIIRVSP